MRYMSVLAIGLAAWLPGQPSSAQSSRSEPLARALTSFMESARLDSLAAADPAEPDRYVAALHFPKQLLVVSARYAAPSLLRERLLNADYREIYLQLQSAGEPRGKFFVQDLGADGFPLQQPEAAHSVDVVYESTTTRTVFDSDWAKQGLSEQQYRTKLSDADQRYARLLEALLAQAKAHTAKR